MCWNPVTGKVNFVDDWLSSKAINAFWADRQCRPKSNKWEPPRGIYLGEKKTTALGKMALVVITSIIWIYSPRRWYWTIVASLVKKRIVVSWINYIWKGIEIAPRSCPGGKWPAQKEKGIGYVRKRKVFKKLLILMVNNAVCLNLVKLIQVDVVWHSG